MKKVLKLLQRTLAIVVVVGLVYSCKKEKVEKIEIDNQFAISVFSDTIKISDFLNNLDSLVLEYIKVTEDGSIYACYSDTVENAVVASDVLSGLDDIIFETSNEFEMPTIPPSPVPIPVELPLDDIFSLPFEYGLTQSLKTLTVTIVTVTIVHAHYMAFFTFAIKNYVNYI